MMFAIGPEDQHRFAELSGDYNPIHLDEIVARRLIGGGAVVQGVHLLLMALEEVFSSGWQTDRRIVSVKAMFVHPVRAGVKLTCKCSRFNENELKLSVRDRGGDVARIQVELADPGEWGRLLVDNDSPHKIEPEDLAGNHMPGAAGNVRLCVTTSLLKAMFPAVFLTLPTYHVSCLLACGRLVGMVCPGLHSLLSEMDIRFEDTEKASPIMRYHVERFDKRFSLAWIPVEAAGMQGVVKAFRRPAPCSQASYSEVICHVNADEFSEQRALVVGGSRGLGEVTAKLLCAGGADVVLTYCRGKGDADKVVNEVRSCGGRTRAVCLDVLDSVLESVSKLTEECLPTHMYYYPSPYIFSGRKGSFSTALFQEFCRYYVNGFVTLLEALKMNGVNKLSILYPSSVAVAQEPPDMMEYVAAKMAGEKVCRLLKEMMPGYHIVVQRFPRLSTDQTMSLSSISSEDPVPFVLGMLRGM